MEKKEKENQESNENQENQENQEKTEDLNDAEQVIKEENKTEEKKLTQEELIGEVMYEKDKGIIYNFWQHFKLNSPFYLTLFVCILIIDYYTVKNLLFSLFSMVLIQIWGYFTHWMSHNRYLHDATGMDWHDIHHGANSKDYHNILIETYVNIVFSGGVVIIILNIILSSLLGPSFQLFNYYVILLWSFIYTTGHLINFHFLKFLTHKNHHISNGLTNYGPDWIDIVLKTKPNNDVIENENSFIINAILGTAIIIWYLNTKYDPVKMIKDLINYFVPLNM